MKKILLEKDYISIFSKLTDEELGELIRALLYYCYYDFEYDFKHSSSRIVFSFLKDSSIYEEGKKKKVKKVQVNDFIDSIVKLFKEKYESFYKIEYIVSNKGKERAAAAKLLSLFKKYYPDYNSEEMYNFISNFFDSVFLIDDNFIQNNMSLSIIFNNINKIFKILKYGNSNQFTKSKSIEVKLKEIEDIIKQDNGKYLQ